MIEYSTALKGAPEAETPRRQLHSESPKQHERAVPDSIASHEDVSPSH